MPLPDQNSARSEAINRLAIEANLLDVAVWLDLQVVGRDTNSPKTLCPFHEDKRPSMHLYSASGSGRAQYHCFACGAHGDVFDLIKRRQNSDFRGALEWLAERYRFVIPSRRAAVRGERIEPRTLGLGRGFDIYRKQTKSETEALRKWAKERQIELSVLQDAEVFAAFPQKIAKQSNINDREMLDALDTAGLLLRGPTIRNRESALLPMDIPPRDFYSSERVIFTIRNDRGAITGFAGRAIGQGQPKYLFSPGFLRGSTLYRLNKVRETLPLRKKKGGQPVVHVFVVEGLMDALRLESIGLHSVALLGSHITDKQVTLLTDLASDLDRDNRSLAVHLLLDADEAGRRGAVNATVKLLDACAETPGMLLDVLTPLTSDVASELQGHDPDELFRDVKDTDAALVRLSLWCESPMKVLLSTAMEVTTKELDSTWDKLSESQHIQAFRDIERRLERHRWISILDRVPAFDCHLRTPPMTKPSWQSPLRGYLSGLRVRINESTISKAPMAKGDHGRLIRALQIAEASTQRREFPIDEGSWDRLQAAIDITIPHLCELLKLESTGVKKRSDKMLAVLVPKGGGDFRLKALPSPEVLSLQQYVLNELLRDYAECPRFRQLIPAVRFTTNSGSPRLETTGPERFRPIGEDAVSFAYALDMDVIEHRAPPQRTGMFRPYFECWRNFISFIDGRLAAFPNPKGKFHVARLDVRRFYNSVTRPVVNAVLLDAVKDALAELAGSPATEDPLACARLFRPEVEARNERAEAIVDWLCDQCFDYEFEPPGTTHEDHPGGLPQGPDLSAYLANISLFPLDRAISELVSKLDRQASEEKGESIREGQPSAVRGAVYARYVDDIVIVARTGHDLARLRTAIEQQLSLVGMELSPKTDPLPVMNESGVREWLTDRRGAALGVSGPFEGPPENAPLSLLEPLADAGETDRSDSLRILHDPRLDDPETSWDELERAVEVILAAPELRHGDLANAARHLWGSMIKRLGSDPTDTINLATDFSVLWSKFKPSPKMSEGLFDEKYDNIAVSDLLAWLDGIERFLNSRQDRSPAFSNSDHEQLHNQRLSMADFVHRGLCESLVERVISARNQSRFEHMLDLKKLVIRRAATLVRRPSQHNDIGIQAGESRAKARLLISLAEAEASTTLMNDAWPRANNMPLVILFHEAVARLRIANQHQDLDELDPLMPLRTSMMNWQRNENVKMPMEMALHFWMPDPHTEVADDLDSAGIALSAFINLATRHAVGLIDRRAALKRFALDGTGGSTLLLLPTPPGLDIHGFLGLRDDDRKVVRVRFQDISDPPFCPKLSWADTSVITGCRWKRDAAPLSEYQYLAPPKKSASNPSLTRWLARAFRSLVIAAKSGDSDRTCPPTASNLLGPGLGHDSSESEWETLGFCVSLEKVSGQAFLRQGEGGLVLEPVLELNDHLWRAGTALADWLGRALSTRQLSTQRLAAPALILEEGEDWAREAILRFSLCRLRGLGLPARPLRLSSESGLPTTIERVLQRLEAFPSDPEQSQGVLGVVHLVATLAEGRAMQARIDTRIDPTTPGGATAILADMVRGQFRADEELALRLPASEPPLALWAPMRRPARALFALAERLAILAAKDPMNSKDPTLQALANGTRLLSVEMQLRSQALELWSLLDLATQRRFQESPPSIAEWSLDTTALLHREQPLPREGATGMSDWHNVRELFRRLHHATNEPQHVDWGAIAGITPLGWLVVLGALTGELSGDWRGGLINTERLGTADPPVLKEMAEKLARAGVDQEGQSSSDLPWGGLKDVISDWGSTFSEKAFTSLRHLDNAAGLRVKQCQSHRFSLINSRGRPTEVETSDGRRRLPTWAITWAKAINEIRDGIERVHTSSDEQRVIARWTETWCDDCLVGIGVVQPAMAALAGKAFAETRQPDSSMPQVVPPIQSISCPSTQSGTESGTDITVKSDSPSQSVVAAIPSTAQSIKSPSTAGQIATSDEDIRIALEELDEEQRKSWTSRGEKPQSHVRIASFQWNVDETYRHPFFDLCMLESKEIDLRKPEKWCDHHYRRSCAELRRRALIKAALKACNRFGVDILLLPEYSTRPETVEWIAREASELAPSVSVWAGTYRLPPRMLHPTTLPAWSAVHEVVLAQNTGKRPVRGKKYPAAAADEIFHPGGLALNPLFADQAIGDVRSYIYELICSEVFLVTSPANLRPLARIRRELLRKFNVGVLGKTLDVMIKEDVLPDIETFARLTAVSEGLGIRRSIMLVPAMTSRSADYSVLGQAGFLASGLTTVFCNAVCGSYGHGQSCFIGHDGWMDAKEAAGLPTLEPYHGACPGIFHLNHWHRGCLGKNEQALVIADIDPIYGAEGKPRPQSLLKPLRLVAHLPVLETWQPKEDEVLNSCRCKRTYQLMKVGQFAIEMLQALKGDNRGNFFTTMDDPDPAILGKALQSLAKCAALPYINDDESNFGWLDQRKKAYLASHMADPNPWPPPVALDWLWVDPGAMEVNNYPQIEVPAYAAPPGGESRSV